MRGLQTLGMYLLALIVIAMPGTLHAQVDRYDGRPAADGDRDIRVGGYMDLGLFMNGDRFDFKQHRLVPMFDANNRYKQTFPPEIDIEYGGSDHAAGQGETKVE